MFKFLGRMGNEYKLQLYSFNISSVHLDTLRMVHECKEIAEMLTNLPQRN